MKQAGLVLLFITVSNLAYGHPSLKPGFLGKDEIRLKHEEFNRIVIQQKVDRGSQMADTDKTLSELHHRNIIGIEIMTAGEDKMSIMSQWGHSMLRLVDDDDDPLNDIVVSFGAGVTDDNTATMQNSRAHVDEKMLAIGKIAFGFFTGSYPISIESLPLFEFVGKYVSDQSRLLDRHIIPTTSQQRKNIVQAIFDLQNGKLKASYYLLGQNCASLVRMVLAYAGLPYFPLKNDYPTKMADYMTRALWTPYPIVEMVNLPAVTAKLSKSINVTNQSQNISRLEIEDLKGKLDVFDKLTLLRFYLLKSKYFKTEVQEYWSEVINSKPGHPDLEEIYGTKFLPPEVYENNGEVFSNAMGTTPEHCRQISNAIIYRGSLPLAETAVTNLKQFEGYYRSYCK